MNHTSVTYFASSDRLWVSGHLPHRRAIASQTCDFSLVGLEISVAQGVERRFRRMKHLRLNAARKTVWHPGHFDAKLPAHPPSMTLGSPHWPPASAKRLAAQGKDAEYFDKLVPRGRSNVGGTWYSFAASPHGRRIVAVLKSRRLYGCRKDDVAQRAQDVLHGGGKRPKKHCGEGQIWVNFPTGLRHRSVQLRNPDFGKKRAFSIHRTQPPATTAPLFLLRTSRPG